MNKASYLLLVYQAKQFAPGVVIGCATILLVIGRSAQHQVGTVTHIFIRPVTRGNVDPAALVSIQLGDKAAMVNSHQFLYNGEKLGVDYKVGRSGTLYIDNFQPISAARSN